MALPNFLIIGAAKSGTTSLYRYLEQHPEIYTSPVKEPRFFAFEGRTFEPSHPLYRSTITTFEAYQKLFDGVADEKAIGEASPSYLSNPSSVDRIKRYIPDAKIIAILRNPVERAYSHFLHSLLRGHEPDGTTFEEALRTESVRVGAHVRNRPYVRMGFYGSQLEPYFEHFDPDKRRVYLFEDLRADEVGLARTVYRFLEVDDTFEPQVATHHAKTGVPTNKLLHRVVRKGTRMASKLRPLMPDSVASILSGIRDRVAHKNLTKPEMPHECRLQLIEIYRDDVSRLEDLLDRDLSHWLRA